MVDVYSRFTQARAMTTRKQETVIEKVKDMFKIMGVPKEMTMDNEFNSTLFDKIIVENKITAKFTDPHEMKKHTAIVERMNGTICGRLAKWR